MFPDNEVARFQAMDGFDVTFEGMNMVGTMNLYGFNMRNEPYDDVCVRQAIAFTMDLEDYNQRVLYGSGSPTMSFLGTSHPEYNPNLEPYPYQPRDVERAEAMLDECGYPRGADGYRFDLKLAYDTRAQRVDMAEIFRQFVEEAGINVIMDASDFNAYVEQVYHDFDYDVMVGSLGLTEPSVGAARLMLSDNIGQANFNNSSAYVNPEVDELWNTYSTTFDPEARRQAIYRIQEIMLEELPYIWVNFSVYPSAYNSAEFTGFHVDTGRGPVLLRTVWWLNGRSAP
jgi:peptide/nickel transport system substrate-binding protein